MILKKSQRYILFFYLFVSLIMAQELQITNYVTHGKEFKPDSIQYVSGSSITLSRVEVRGIWAESDAPSPLQALTWFSNPNDDFPLALLDWANVIIDTTWTDLGDSKFSISTDIRKGFQNGSWATTPVTTGWMAENEVYTLEVQSVINSIATTVETFIFDISGTKDFENVEYRISYEGEKTNSQITKGDAEVRFRLSDAARSFILPSGTEFLRINIKNSAGIFYTMDHKVVYVEANEAGLNLTITPEAYPPQGYFSAGDTIDVNINLTNDGGTVLNWAESATNGLDRLYYYLSGPKQDYEKLHYGVRIISSGVLQTDPITDLPYTNPIKIILPSELPGDVGTYSLMIRVRRYFAGTYYFAQLKDIQVGSSGITEIPVGNCESCHNPQSTFPEMPILFNHGYAEWPQCLICHTDDQGAAFSKIVHEKTMHKPLFTGVKGDCSLCHINNSNDKFTSDADLVCTACHNPTPYFPADHKNSVPLYSESGISCATLNCHSAGGLGVFKTIGETHAALPAKYIGGTLTSIFTNDAPVIDGQIDAAWNNAISITTLKGVELKAMYDSENIYLLAKWKDGHNLLGGDAPPSESIQKNLWTYDGSNWNKSGNEDRFAFLWDAGDTHGASCGNFCHSDGTMATNDGNADVWHWKAVRSNPLGLSDDKWWSTSGRDSDASEINAYFDNVNINGNGPLYSGPITNGNFIIIPKGGTTANLETNIDILNTYPGYYLNANASGSRWEVKSAGKFDEETGYWTVEFQRALDTGNSDDIVFSANSSVKFSTATFDNTGGGHASQGVDVGEYTLVIGSITNVEELTNDIPNEYKLNQNYPNPFNPSTTISFDLVEQGKVSLILYNAIGEKITQLLDTEFLPGSHKITFNANNLTSGVYFYRLKVNKFNATKKLLYLK